ncbi:hypothetical protein AN1V17_01690 [Vallitalea sediminicola]
MRKLSIYLVIFVVLIAGCSSSSKKEKLDVDVYSSDGSSNNIVVNEDNDEIAEDDIEENIITIDTIFPDEIGFGWIYNGTLDYGRKEEIIKCYTEDTVKHIIIEGEEDDLSDGESGHDSTFKKDFQITADGIMLSHKGSPVYLDNQDFYLLKNPIEVGNSWELEWYYGAKAKTEIIDVTDTTIVTETVITDDNDDYYFKKARTTFEQGKGILTLEKTAEEDFTITEKIYTFGKDYLKEVVDTENNQ